MALASVRIEDTKYNLYRKFLEENGTNFNYHIGKIIEEELKNKKTFTNEKGGEIKCKKQ